LVILSVCIPRYFVLESSLRRAVLGSWSFALPLPSNLAHTNVTVI
jgi:hypothetical protein